MCDVDADFPSFYQASWVRAKIEHFCCACCEIVRPKDLYHLSKGCWDGRFSVYKHCARCWRLFEALDSKNPGEVALELNCGEVYEGKDADMLFMAFMTKDEAQRFAQRSKERHG